MELWAKFIESPEARAGAVATIVTLIMMFVKPYLPTGTDADDPTIATENRWLPLIHAGLTLALCIGGAVYARQDVVESGFWGLVGAGTAVGVMRGGKLAIEGDKTERQRAAAVKKAKALDKKVDKLETVIDEHSQPPEV